MFCFIQTCGDFANADEVWQSRWNHGATEAFISKDSNNYIIVSCEPKDYGADVFIIFRIQGTIPPGERIGLSFDGGDFLYFNIHNGAITNINNKCPSCMYGYQKIINSFKKFNRVTVLSENKESATFSLKGASKEIYDCRVN